MNVWPIKSFGDVIELQRGHDLPTQERYQGQVPVIGSFGITGRHNEAKYPGPGVAIGRSGAAIGTATYVEEPYWPLNTCLFVSDFKGNDPRWVFYLLDYLDFTQFNSGSAQPSLNRNFLRDIPISTPSVREQEAIAEVLRALDDKIITNTMISRTIDEFLAASFARIVRNSSTIRLGEIASVNPKSCQPLVGGSLRYIDISSVGQGSYEFPAVSSWKDAPSRARRQVLRGDTLWSTVRPNRRSHALNLSADELLVGSTGLVVLRPHSVGYAYLYEATKTLEFSAYLENVSEGSAYPAVRPNRFENAPIKWASSDERDSFEMNADPLRQMQHNIKVENRHLAKTRATLLPQLMSGKVRVKDAEALAESTV